MYIKYINIPFSSPYTLKQRNLESLSYFKIKIFTEKKNITIQNRLVQLVNTSEKQ